MNLLDTKNPLEILMRAEKSLGNVWLLSEEGDQLNLKSQLSKYVFLTIFENKDIIKRCKIVFENSEDEMEFEQGMNNKRGDK